jgi:ferredoxin
MAFAAELLARYGPRVRLHPADESRLDLDALLGAAVPDTLVYACGPTRLLDAVEKLCQTWPAASLHLEHFEATHLHPPLRAEPFEIELVDSGLTLTVPPERSVLEVIEDAGILVLSSCREGTCGTCETPVLEGIVDHRDSVLTPVEQAENRAMMVCCSRAISARLVLEL